MGSEAAKPDEKLFVGKVKLDCRLRVSFDEEDMIRSDEDAKDAAEDAVRECLSNEVECNIYKAEAFRDGE